MGTPELLVALDLAGIFVFAVTGALVAVRLDLDVFGALVLAGVTGLGGGVVRDLLIGAVPPAALSDWRYLVVPLVATLLTFYAHAALERREHVISLLDAAGLSLFCVTGTLKALDHGLGPLPASLLGLVTGVGGGIARDLLGGRPPQVLRSDLYATPALVAALVAAVGERLGLWTPAVAVGAVVLCFTWRLLAMRRGWNAPRAGRVR